MLYLVASSDPTFWNGEILAASIRIPELRYTIVAFGASLTQLEDLRESLGAPMPTPVTEKRLHP